MTTARIQCFFTGLLMLAACGTDDAGGLPPHNAADGSSGALGSAGAAGDGASNFGGNGGEPTASTPVCTGTWDITSTEVLRVPRGIQIGIPTVSPDELEIFYMASDVDGVTHVRRAVRSSKTTVFPERDAVSELDAACTTSTDDRNMDLSSDGLRLYMVCFQSIQPVPIPLRIARRSTRDAPFVLDPPTSATVGRSTSVARDELAVYATSLTYPGLPLMYERASRTAPFEPGKPVPGLESTNFLGLDPAPDGLSIFGGLNDDVVTAVRTEPSEALGVPTPLVMAEVGHVLGSPEISQDCSTLYYVDLDQTTTTLGASIRALVR